MNPTRLRLNRWARRHPLLAVTVFFIYITLVLAVFSTVRADARICDPRNDASDCAYSTTWPTTVHQTDRQLAHDRWSPMRPGRVFSSMTRHERHKFDRLYADARRRYLATHRLIGSVPGAVSFRDHGSCAYRTDPLEYRTYLCHDAYEIHSGGTSGWGEIMDATSRLTLGCGGEIVIGAAAGGVGTMISGFGSLVGATGAGGYAAIKCMGPKALTILRGASQ